MITTTGQSIIAKYLIDQAPAYASYIAIGCGSRPRTAYSDTVTSYSITTNVANIAAAAHPFLPGDLVTISSNALSINGTYTVKSPVGTDWFKVDKTADNIASQNISGTAVLNFKNKEVLDFEMFRVPITSRTFEQNNITGVTNVILSGDLPSQERYLITEAGIFSSGSNPTAAGIDSRIINNFTTGENWEYHGLTQATTISTPTEAIYSSGTGSIYTNLTGVVFGIDNTNAIFENSYRTTAVKNEKPRLLQGSIAVSTGMSRIDTTPANGIWTATYTSSNVALAQPHIHLIGKQYPFDKNASSDEIKLAMSVLVVDPATPMPATLNILMEFGSDETESGVGTDFAKAQFTISSADYISSNAYFTKTLSLGDFKKSSGFNWATVDIVKIFVSVPTANLAVTTKSLTNNIATITTSTTPKMIVGQMLTVSGVDATFNGTFSATNVNTTTNTISYAVTAANVSSTAVSPNGVVQYSDGSYYVALDGLRFENNRDRENNPIYGMVSYSPVQDELNKPVLKEVNSANIFEAKFNLDLNVGV